MKKKGWELELAREIKRAKEFGFIRGLNDCGIFVANCVKAMTGLDPAANLRGKYSDEAGAIKRLEKYNGKMLNVWLAFVKENNGIEEIPIAKATSGDVLYKPGIEGGLDLLAVVETGGRWAITMHSTHGIRILPISDFKKAWRLPNGG